MASEPANDKRSSSWRTALFRFIHSETPLDEHLYPPLKLNVRFRPYEKRDFDPCLEIYRKNETGRFPKGHLSEFTEYLDKDPKSFIVAELDSRVVGYGGINLIGPNVALLCYGIVHPEFQRQRIGATLVLLRITQLTSDQDGVYIFILAVGASMPIYNQFGFLPTGKWKTEDGKEHPLGMLHVSQSTLKRIKSVLKRRGVEIQGNLVLCSSGDTVCEIQHDAYGVARFHFRPRTEDSE
jgi:N-acetylglutamate synthase-like GNAT family acetyltransferase